jgi:ubiquinol-cytochrome c reductase cytochrome c subunit
MIRTKSLRANIFLLLMMAASAPHAGAEPASAAPGTGSAERGQKLYQKNMCFTCHGSAGNGGERTSGPRLAPNVWPLEAMKIQVRNPRQDMPRYGEKFLSDADLADIHAYLSTIKPGPQAKDIPLLANL